MAQFVIMCDTFNCGGGRGRIQLSRLRPVLDSTLKETVGDFRFVYLRLPKSAGLYTREIIMKTLTFYWANLLWVVLGISCQPLIDSGRDVLDNGQGDELTGVIWKLELIESEDGSVFVPNPQETYILQFRTDGTVSGKDDCNDCEGQYKASTDGSISISVSCTEIACGIGYGEMLNQAKTYRIEKERLLIDFIDRNGQRRVLNHHAEAE